MGNSQRVAAKHYLQVTDQDYELAVSEPTGPVQNPVQSAAGATRKAPAAEMPIGFSPGGYDALRTCTNDPLSPAGLEPTTYGLKVRCSTN